MRRVALTPLFAAASAGLAIWFSLGSLAVTAADPASRIGFLPSPWLAAGLMIAGGGIAWLAGLSTARSLPLFFSLILILPWIPGNVPAVFLFWTGPVVYFVWLAVAVGVAHSRKVRLKPDPTKKPDPTSTPNPARTPMLLAGTIALVCYLASGWWLAAILPGGDEPHYLVITQSLLRDGDIRIENNYAERQYRDYFPESLNPHALVRGVNGALYSVHAPGLAAIVAPAFAMYGYPAVVVLLAFVAAAGTTLVWRFGYRLTGSEPAAWFAWASAALSVPFFFQAFCVYPDGLAATLVLIACAPIFEDELSLAAWAGIGAALALLPWLHTRLAVIAVVLGGVLLLRLLQTRDRVSRIAAFLTVPVVAAVAWLGFFRILYGRFDPSAPYAGDTQTHAVEILNGLPALLFDHEFGVLPNAPVYGVCLVALVMLARQRARIAAELTAVAVPYLLAVSAFHMWWGGTSAPARFLVPILPMLAIPAAHLWASTPRVTTRAVAAGALVFSIATTASLVIVDRGMMAYNVRDGLGRAAEWVNPVVDVALALPSFFRHPTAIAVSRAGVWMAMLGLALLALRALERGGARRAVLAVATPAMLALATMAAAGTIWHLDGIAPLNPEKSQMRLLGSYDEQWRPAGVTMRPVAMVAASEVLRKVTVVTPDRRERAAAGTLMMAPSIVPGGVYELRVKDHEARGTARLIIGRRARPIQTWDLGRDFHNGVVRFSLPVNVGSLIVTGDRRAPAGALTLHPVSLWQGSTRLTSDISRRVDRYGTALVFFFDLNATFPEDPGFWIAGARRTQIAVAAADGNAPLHMLIRNGAVQNDVRVEIDGAAQTLQLQPREERTIPVPIDPQRPGALVRIATQTGFHPSEVEPGSTDPRFLGAWVEFH